MLEQHWRSYKWRSGSRYNNIYLQHNLLGIWSVINIWGDCNQKDGKNKISFFERHRDASSYVNVLNKKREQKYALL